MSWRDWFSRKEPQVSAASIGNKVRTMISPTVNSYNFTADLERVEDAHGRGTQRIVVHDNGVRICVIDIDEITGVYSFASPEQTLTNQPINDEAIVFQARTVILRYAKLKMGVRKPAETHVVSKPQLRVEEGHLKYAATEFAEQLAFSLKLNRCKVSAMKSYHHSAVPQYILLVVDEQSKSSSVIHLSEKAYVLITISGDKKYTVELRAGNMHRGQTFHEESDALARASEDLAVLRNFLDQ